ncbi:hypothetical protein ACSBR2_001715 [Camellia fascicularis]
MEAIRISCAGYPTRKPFLEFVDRFGVLAPEVLDGSTDEFEACKRLLEKVGLQGNQAGMRGMVARDGFLFLFFFCFFSSDLTGGLGVLVHFLLIFCVKCGREW